MGDREPLGWETGSHSDGKQGATRMGNREPLGWETGSHSDGRQGVIMNKIDADLIFKEMVTSSLSNQLGGNMLTELSSFACTRFAFLSLPQFDY